jgi:four helix bundle protein
MFRFEQLKVWHKAVELYDVVDGIADRFPAKVRFGLADQFRRAALSVSSNIAEGSGRETLKEFRYFLSVAKGSAFEVVSIAIVSRRRGLITGQEHADVYSRAEEISRMLTALKRSPVSRP